MKGRILVVLAASVFLWSCDSPRTPTWDGRVHSQLDCIVSPVGMYGGYTEYRWSWFGADSGFVSCPPVIHEECCIPNPTGSGRDVRFVDDPRVLVHLGNCVN
jgi:hypothetical protein